MRTWSADSQASPRAAWALMSRPGAWPAWAPHIVGAIGLGSGEVQEGATGFARLLGVIPVPVHVQREGPGSLVDLVAGPGRADRAPRDPARRWLHGGRRPRRPAHAAARARLRAGHPGLAEPPRPRRRPVIVRRARPGDEHALARIHRDMGDYYAELAPERFQRPAEEGLVEMVREELQDSGKPPLPALELVAPPLGEELVGVELREVGAQRAGELAGVARAGVPEEDDLAGVDLEHLDLLERVGGAEE